MIAINPTWTPSRHRDARFPTVCLHGLNIHAVKEHEVVQHIMTQLEASRGGWVVTPNLDILRRSFHDASFRRLIEPADVVLADGMPLVWASKLRGTALPERVAGSNLILSLTAAAARAGRRVYLLGGEPGAASDAGQVLKRRFSRLQIAGAHCPSMGFDQDPAKVDEIAQRLVKAKPEIIFVALGCPKQEQLIARLRHHLPRAWWLGVGISFSFIAGRVTRAPRFVQQVGLEWAHRLMQEPRRLGKRYLIDGLPFALRLFGRAAVERLLTPAPSPPTGQPAGEKIHASGHLFNDADTAPLPDTAAISSRRRRAHREERVALQSGD